ncbi:hypothetical protein [Flavobacterium reichenbachii]|uniref:Uncharacterized protein n=1 Tax=Flavobacterium reichenbachii TaxID=362418 RepID=A0A085ZHZ6_9FLAO|nr:hypothetical protein [Flavobacterium reichenbachii]KFF04060.1 hypothetical protein IW19_00265 [Flavobacterium reichenbachii]OXB12888.1 hypothetical protein B0A68_17145 [Flavobacterium reichenbachii]
MKSKIEGYNCSEYLNEYYSFGLFNATECQILYSHENSQIDLEKNFFRIGEIYDDFDLILGYRKDKNGIWGHYNNHWDGKFEIISSSIKELCEGWYQRDSNYWCEMNSELQWNEISNFFNNNIYIYKWKAKKIKEFIDYCIKTKQLNEFYIKANKTLIAITKTNGFCSRSFTNMVLIDYKLDKQTFLIYFKKDFFDYNPKMKEYKIDKIQEVIKEINEWITNIE